VSMQKTSRGQSPQAQALDNLCDTLLPRLISGRLRLSDAEALDNEAPSIC